jgi:hypothetical protein
VRGAGGGPTPEIDIEGLARAGDYLNPAPRRRPGRAEIQLDVVALPPS